MLGRTEGNNVVAFPGDESLVGRFVDVRIDATTGSTFAGTLASAVPVPDRSPDSPLAATAA